MLAFLDFEASSLGKTSYPIEVAWVFEDGRSEAHLIRPAPQWTDWDPQAEAVHGIARPMLEIEGTPHDSVARRMIDVLGGHQLYASAPSWDGKWLSALLRAAGIPRHAIRLRDTDEARQALATELLCPVLEGAELERAVARVLGHVRHVAERQPVRHRALGDAERERQNWLMVGAIASEEKERFLVR